MLETDLTTDEVAAALRLHRATVQRLLKTGRLKGYQIGRSWRVSRTALEAFREGGRISVRPTPPEGDVFEPIASLTDNEVWEEALLSEEGLAAVPPIPADALRREGMYKERG